MSLTIPPAQLHSRPILAYHSAIDDFNIGRQSEALSAVCAYTAECALLFRLHFSEPENIGRQFTIGGIRRGQIMQRLSGNRRGFTLLEMVVTTLILSILAATVVVRMQSTSDRATINQADQLRRDIAHIQVLALSWGVSLRLAIASDGSGYSVV